MLVNKEQRALTEQSLNALMAQARAGQATAWEEIFVFLHRRLTALARQRLPQDYEDTVQETLTVIAEHLADLDNAEHLLKFANEVLRKKIAAYYQRRQAGRYLPRRINHPLYRPDEQWDIKEAEHVLAEALDRLSQVLPGCREFLLEVAEGASLDELSEHFGIPRSRIPYRLFRCRRALRRILTQEFGVLIQDARLVCLSADNPPLVRPWIPFYEVDDEGQ